MKKGSKKLVEQIKDVLENKASGKDKLELLQMMSRQLASFNQGLKDVNKLKDLRKSSK